VHYLSAFSLLPEIQYKSGRIALIIDAAGLSAAFDTVGRDAVLLAVSEAGLRRKLRLSQVFVDVLVYRDVALF